VFFFVERKREREAYRQTDRGGERERERLLVTIGSRRSRLALASFDLAVTPTMANLAFVSARAHTVWILVLVNPGTGCLVTRQREIVRGMGKR
jgi:hypothetical protein